MVFDRSIAPDVRRVAKSSLRSLEIRCQPDGRRDPSCLCGSNRGTGGSRPGVEAFLVSRGIELSYANAELGAAHGASLKGRILLRDDLPPAVEFSVLVHEIAHLCSAVGYVRSDPRESVSVGQAGVNCAGCCSDRASRATARYDVSRPRDVVRAAAARADIDKLAPHDLRRTCSWLCHLAGGELDQIQFLLGHVSIQTRERYLGCKQRLRCAVNDRLGIEPDAE